MSVAVAEPLAVENPQPRSRRRTASRAFFNRETLNAESSITRIVHKFSSVPKDEMSDSEATGTHLTKGAREQLVTLAEHVGECLAQTCGDILTVHDLKTLSAEHVLLAVSSLLGPGATSTDLILMAVDQALATYKKNLELHQSAKAAAAARVATTTSDPMDVTS